MRDPERHSGMVQGHDPSGGRPAPDAEAAPGADPVGMALTASEHEIPAVQYHLAQFLADHLSDCCQVFDGDLEQALILALLWQRFVGAHHMAQIDRDKASEMVWMPALRLSDAVGLPRETVRRKLKLLEAKGLVLSDASKGWALAGDVGHSPGNDRLDELERRMRRRLTRLFVRLRATLGGA
ncbi:hypothetical protein [Rubellimicrobium roseum]|uniref:Uncharacterized protein n=1 Tax=Rubellimicrobium roseum TaxID=687525 RepID=A0A5C4NAX9_9RHOB|nr:hypothetical protein [Rubellimicrobium roseum]TNC65386.1 hypothetical protein FHG71_17690 [Rubellimicrobium roseum]